MALITLDQINAFRQAVEKIFKSGKMGDHGLCWVIDDKMYAENDSSIFFDNFSIGYTIMRSLMDHTENYIGKMGDFDKNRQTLCCLIMALSNEELLEVVNAPV
jgi:hypothetical protein